MAVLLLQRPANSLVESLDGFLGFLSDVAEDGMNHLALVEAFLALDDILSGNAALGEINVSYAGSRS